MSDRESNSGMQSRRAVLKKSAIGTSIGISGLIGPVSAESVDEDEVKKLEEHPHVQQILSEIDQQSLPNAEYIEKRRIGEDGELSMLKAEYGFGTLVIAKYGGEVGAMFAFDVDQRSQLPKNYPSVPGGAGSLLGSDEGVIFRRPATGREEELVLSALDVDGEIASAQVFTGTNVDGFHANVGIEAAETSDTGVRSFRITVDQGSFDSKRQELTPGFESRFSVEPVDEVEVAAVGSTIKRIIIDWAEGFLAKELSELVGPCGPSCTSCADWIISLALDCRTCGPVCTTSTSGVGAFVCVLQCGGPRVCSSYGTRAC
ncbi:hypothetical protein JCM9743_07980 [Natrinema sp. JCM 9743]